MGSQEIELSGAVEGACLVVDAEPLAGLAAGEKVELEARALTRGERAAVEKGAPFAERRPLYGLCRDGVLAAASSALEGPVREMLALGLAVKVAAHRTLSPLRSYEGLVLDLPEQEPLERWCALARRGVRVPVDAEVLEANLNVSDAHPELPSGPVTVSVGTESAGLLPVRLTAPDGEHACFELDRREHSFEVFKALEGRILSKAAVEGRDGWTQTAKRYMRVYMAL